MYVFKVRDPATKVVESRKECSIVHVEGLLRSLQGRLGFGKGTVSQHYRQGHSFATAILYPCLNPETFLVGSLTPK